MSTPSPIRRNTPRFGDSARILQQARIAGPMPWVIAIMIALTVMAAAAGLALNNIAGSARDEIAGGMTVQIVEGAPVERDRQAERAVSYFSNRDDVASVRRVPDEELAELLEPWLGDVGMAEDDGVPIPALIDVRLSGPVTAERLSLMRSELLAQAPAARIDAQASWLGPVFDAIRSLQFLAHRPDRAARADQRGGGVAGGTQRLGLQPRNDRSDPPPWRHRRADRGHFPALHRVGRGTRRRGRAAARAWRQCSFSVSNLRNLDRD